MKRNVPFIIGVLITFGLFWSCTHNPRMIFKDPESVQKVNYLQEKLAINPRDLELRMELGRLFLSEGMTNQAVIEFENVLGIDSNYTQAYLLLSLALQKRRNPGLKKAQALLEKASQIEPRNANVHLNLGQIYDKQKEEAKAVEVFHKTIELSNDPPTLVSAHLGLMAIYKRRGDSIKANEEHEAVLKIYPAIDDIIKQAEINRITPAPKYMEGDRFHPHLEERIKRLREEIIKEP